MTRTKNARILMVFAVFITVISTYAYAGPVVCDGELAESTRRASGKLLVALGSAYGAIGFIEAGQPENIHYLWKLTQPVAMAKEAESLFKKFSETPVSGRLSTLNTRVRAADYEALYTGFVKKGIVLPAKAWGEISSLAREKGINGLMDL